MLSTAQLLHTVCLYFDYVTLFAHVNLYCSVQYFYEIICEKMSQSPDYVRLLVHHAKLYQQDAPIFMTLDGQPNVYCFYMGFMTAIATPDPDPQSEVTPMMLILLTINYLLPQDLQVKCLCLLSRCVLLVAFLLLQPFINNCFLLYQPTLQTYQQGSYEI